VVPAKDVSATMATFGYAIDPDDIGLDPEVKDVCQIVARKILAERVDAEVRDKKVAVRFGQKRVGRPTTPPPPGPDCTGEPAHAPVRARPHVGFAHAVTAPPVRPGRLHRRPHRS
jgi:hypothetical protein